MYQPGDQLVYSFNDTKGYGFHGDFFNGWEDGVVDVSFILTDFYGLKWICNFFSDFKTISVLLSIAEPTLMDFPRNVEPLPRNILLTVLGKMIFIMIR